MCLLIFVVIFTISFRCGVRTRLIVSCTGHELDVHGQFVVVSCSASKEAYKSSF